MITQLDVHIIFLAILIIDVTLFIVKAKIVRVFELKFVEMRRRVIFVVAQIANVKLLQGLLRIELQLFVSLELGLSEFNLFFESHLVFIRYGGLIMIRK